MTPELERLGVALAGRYRLVREIGRGGMATVYRADDLKHDRPVALKVLKPELAASLGAERFLREITLTARLDHPHILPLLDSGEAGGLLYYVMPYVEGESLRERLDREAQLPLDDALRIAREAADALSHAHRHGVVHRDIKPGNILLADGHARVADFGIARAMTAAGERTLTETGLAVGTPAYMSPEQASGEREIDARSDIYSLGCVLYEMLAGQPPHTGATAGAIFARKALEPVPSLRVVRDTVPLAVERAVTRALARVPADRFGTAGDFAAALAVGADVEKPAPDRVRVWFTRRAIGFLAVAAALTLADVGGLRTRLMGGGTPAIESLAVLPLENHSGNPEQDYFAAGMHEALIVDLGKLSGLKRVTARPSVLRYVKTDKTPRQIGEELGVDALLSASVTRAGDRIRVNATLVRASTGESLWGDKFDRDLQDVLALQDDIVGAIARQVQLRLSSRDRAELTGARRVNRAAYDAYLKGKYELSTFTPEGFEKGLALLNEAVTLDSTEPLAWAGLSQIYSLMEIFSPTPRPDAIPRAKEAALRALALDETLAEAHVALADIQSANEYDYAAGGKSYRRALELNPNLPDAHIHYSWDLAVFGTEEEALAAMRRGMQLDPYSPLYTAWYAGMLWEFGRFDEAIAEANKAIELEPDFPVALFVLGLSYLDKGHFAEAIATHERTLAKYPRQGFSWTLARTYALAGQPAKARRILDRLKTGTPGDTPHPWFIASAYAALGEHEEALDWLEKAYDARILFLPNLNRERASGATFGVLRGHPRFQELLRRLNLTG